MLNLQKNVQKPAVDAPATPHGHATYVWVYLVALSVAELAVGSDGALGFYLHLGLVFLFLVGSYASGGQAGALHVALVAVPFIHLLAATVPAWSSDLTVQRALLHAPLLLSTLIAARALGYALLGGLRRNFLYTPLLALTGPLIGVLVYLVYTGMHPAVLASGMAWSEVVGGLDRSAMWPALGLLLAGLGETLLFRGVLLTAAVNLLGPVRGVAFSALACASLYLGNPWPLPALMLLLGVLLGIAALRPGTLLGLGLAHGLAYVTALVVMPLFGAA